MINDFESNQGYANQLVNQIHQYAVWTPLFIASSIILTLG